MPEQLDVRRVRLLLRQKIVGAGQNMRKVSIALGWKPDELTRRLRGTYELHVDHVYAVLAHLGIPPNQFWKDLEREAGLDPVILGGMTFGDMLSAIRRVVQEELEKRGLHAPPTEEAPKDEVPAKGEPEPETAPESEENGNGDS